MKQKKFGAVVGISALALLATACASSATSSSATTTSTQQASTSGTPVKVMLTTTLSSPSLAFPEQQDGADTAAKAINAAGGIKGHPVEIITCNDSLDANTSEECVQQGIADHVVAFIGTSNSFTALTLPLLDAAKIPWIGLNDISDDQWTNAMSYPLDGGSAISPIAMAKYLVGIGDKKIGLVWVNVPQGAYLSKLGETDVTDAGGTVAGYTSYTLGAADFSSTAAEVEKSKPDAIFLFAAEQDAAKLVEAIRQAGFTGPITAGNGTFDPSELAALGSEAGLIYANQGVRSVADPAVGAEFKKEVATSTSNAKDEFWTREWLSVHTIANALNASSGPLTAATLIHELNTLTDLPTYGVVNSINFTTAPPVAQYPRIHNTVEYTYVWDYKSASFVPFSSTNSGQ